MGTEFGFYFTLDGGEQWTESSAGLPTISVKNMAILRKEFPPMLEEMKAPWTPGRTPRLN